MNNLQYLYDNSDDFSANIDHHLVIFERWYTDYLDGQRFYDDMEASQWLRQEHGGTGSDYNDGRLPEPCCRLSYGGAEYASVELGDGTGYVKVDRDDRLRDLVTDMLGEFEYAEATLDGLSSSLRFRAKRDEFRDRAIALGVRMPA